MKTHLLNLLLPSLAMCGLHSFARMPWGWAAAAAFVGWPLLGTVVTADDDLPGGWSNPDGTARPDWMTTGYWAHVLGNASIAISIGLIEALFRFRQHVVVLVVMLVTTVLLAAFLRRRARKDESDHG